MTPNRLQQALHGQHEQERQHVIKSFRGDSRLNRRSARMQDCGSHGRLYLEGTPPKVRIWIHRCGDRLCPLCAVFRQAKVEERVLAALNRIENPRHVTLTLQTFPGGSLKAALTHLRESFRRLRRNADWVSRVQGGIYSVEVTRNPKDGRWHPHLHIITSGEFFPQRLLSACWEVASRGSQVLWVCKADRHHARYLAKYIGKPERLQDWPENAIREYAKEISSVRMIQTFGELHGTPLTDRDERPEPPATRYRISLSRLRAGAERGDSAAISLLIAVSVRWPRLSGFCREFLSRGPPVVSMPGEDLTEIAQRAVDHRARFVMKYAEPVETATRGIHVENRIVPKNHDSTVGPRVRKLFDEPNRD